MAAREFTGKQMRAVVEAAEVEAAEVEAAAPAEPETVQRRTAPVVVGAADDRSELHADRVADQVVARRAGVGLDSHAHGPGCGHDAAVQQAFSGGTAVVGAAGGTLDDVTSEALAATRGGGAPLPAEVRRTMEAGFGHGLPGAVRIHTDARADQLAASMGAVAFTQGHDIHFRAGAFQPDRPDGQHLLAHELTHVLQQQGGTVQRKLGGTAAALRNQGALDGDGGRSSGLLRRVTGRLTNWDRLVNAVKAYETAEAKALAGGINKFSAAPHKPKLLALISSIQRAIQKWREANDDEQQTKALNKKVAEEGAQDADTRTKASRRQAVAMLVPRVKDEERMLSKDDIDEWLRSSGTDGATVTGTGGSQRGGVNEVHKVEKQQLWRGEGGFFKADHGMSAKDTYQDHEQETGIRQVDPNAGARAVALYRLDQLFGAGVTAKVEFAVYDGGDGPRMGTFMEKAKGTAGNETTWARDKDGARQLGGATSLDDPVLQRGLNVLQLLDAIAGQLDRHSGNFFVATDADGNVTGVTGIDLDMSFGEEMTTTGREGPQWQGVGKDRKMVRPADTAASAHNYRGLPEYIDEAFGLRILQVRPRDVEDALKGLLTDKEIAATLARFSEVQAAVQKAKDAGTLVKKWDGETAKQGRVASKDLGWNSKRKNYRDDLDAVMLGQRKTALAEKFLRVLRHPNLARLAPALAASPELLEAVTEAFTYEGGVALINPVATWVLDHDVTPQEEDQLVFQAARHAFGDQVMAPLAKRVDDGATPGRGDITSAITPGLATALSWFGSWLELDRLEKSL